MSRLNVMHITDTLAVGGAERMAVNLVNLLPRERYSPHLCTTRDEGPLAELVAGDVGRLRLTRRQRFDIGAVRQLVGYIRRNRIRVLHAHENSLFIAVAASLFPPRPAVVWHDNYGRCELEERPAWLYRLAAAGVGGVIAVNQTLVEWSRRRLGLPEQRVWYVPNCVYEGGPSRPPGDLPGEAGGRIVCVANLRPQKDHLNLVRAMAVVAGDFPAAHLLLVGGGTDQTHRRAIEQEIARLGLGGQVTLLGERSDVGAILRACDVGVLSSASEGLPLSLLEYGMAGLPAVTTRVGQCAEVLDDGRAGILVPPARPDLLGQALASVLSSREARARMAEVLQRRVREVYSPDAVILQVCGVYDAVARPAAGAA